MLTGEPTKPIPQMTFGTIQTTARMRVASVLCGERRRGIVYVTRSRRSSRAVHHRRGIVAFLLPVLRAFLITLAPPNAQAANSASCSQRAGNCWRVGASARCTAGSRLGSLASAIDSRSHGVVSSCQSAATS